MVLKFQLLLLLFTTMFVTHAQWQPPILNPALNIGYSTPSLHVREWLKGTPIQSFQKGKVYVLEFWATWCAPCRAAVPHLSKLAHKYKNKVSFIGIDIYEEVNHTTFKQVKTFVDNMGNKMDYNVATDDSDFMVENWLKASGEDRNGIPRTFVINGDGKLAWTGHPFYLNKVLSKIVHKKWNLKDYSVKRNLNRYIEVLDDSLKFNLTQYQGNWDFPRIVNGVKIEPDTIGMPDSVLLLAKEELKKEPMLNYAPHFIFNTFYALLKTNPHKAYEYGKEVLTTPVYTTHSDYDLGAQYLIAPIEYCSEKINLPAEIYKLYAEAYLVDYNVGIIHIIYDKGVNYSKVYKKVAYGYSRANSKHKAIKYQRKAIKSLKKKKGSSTGDMLELKKELYKYKKM